MSNPNPIDPAPTAALEESTRISTLVINEVQLLLAQKRTAMATLRTGIAVFALPLSVLSILVATSKYYELGQVLGLIIPLILLSTILVALGSYLVWRAIKQIRVYDNHIGELKNQHSILTRLVD